MNKLKLADVIFEVTQKPAVYYITKRSQIIHN